MRSGLRDWPGGMATNAVTGVIMAGNPRNRLTFAEARTLVSHGSSCRMGASAVLATPRGHARRDEMVARRHTPGCHQGRRPQWQARGVMPLESRMIPGSHPLVIAFALGRRRVAP